MAPFRVGIVGSGVSSIYLVSNLLKKVPDALIDIFESQKFPYGLLRTSVSPKSSEFKSIIARFDQTLKSTNVNLYLDSDIDASNIQQLSAKYNAVVVATGGGKARRLPNVRYNRSTVISSDDFTQWYNGFAELNLPKKECPVVCIIGYGNVALDVASYFMSKYSEIKHIPYSKAAKNYLRLIGSSNAIIIGRKLIANSSFTLSELRSFALEHNPKLICDNQNAADPKTRCIVSNSIEGSKGKLLSNTEIIAVEDSLDGCLVKLRSLDSVSTIYADIIITCLGFESSTGISALKTGWALTGKGNIANSSMTSSQVSDILAKMKSQGYDILQEPTVEYKSSSKYNWLYHSACEEVAGSLDGTFRSVIHTKETEDYLFKTMRMWDS